MRGRVLVAVGLAGLLSACTSGSSPTPPAASPSESLTVTISRDPVPRAPSRTACYRLSSDQLTRPSNSSRTVGCARRHTARTIFVGRLGTVVDGHAVAVDSAAVQRQLSTTCPRKLAAYVGGSTGTRQLSRIDVVWYSPTLAQSDRGADWFRCDLIAFAGQEALLPLPRGTLKGVLDRPGALERYGLCGTAAPGARGFERVICSRPHSWKAFDTIDLPGREKYPGTAKVRSAGDDVCQARARSRAADSLRFRYGWEWPTRDQWLGGQHYGYCWVPA